MKGLQTLWAVGPVGESGSLLLGLFDGPQRILELGVLEHVMHVLVTELLVVVMCLIPDLLELLN